MKKINFKEEYDLTFLWVGTNDVLTKTSFITSPIKIIFKQKKAENIEEFKKNYKKIIEKLDNISKKIYVISPLILGENIESVWNKNLKVLSGEIKKIIKENKKIEYIDIQKIFFNYLSSKDTSDYMLETPGIISDYLAKKPEKIKQISKKRHLYLTIDGVHLNKKGAGIVADIIYKKVKNEKN